MVRLIKDDVELRLSDQDWEEFRLWQNERVYGSTTKDKIMNVMRKHGVSDYKNIGGRNPALNKALREAVSVTMGDITEAANALGMTYGWVYNRLGGYMGHPNTDIGKIAEENGLTYHQAYYRWVTKEQ